MKKFSNLLITAFVTVSLIAFASKGLAQESETYGFLNIVNLVPNSKNCKIGIAGIDAMPGGLVSAKSTGWFMVPSGKVMLTMEIEGYDKSSGSIDIIDNLSSVIVIFIEPSPTLDKDGKPLRSKIKVKRCDIREDKTGFSLKLMSFCPDENRFLIGQNPINIKLFEAIDIPKWNGGGFKITRNQEVIGTVLTETEKGPFYLFVGTDHAGKYCSTIVRAEKQDLPPWMKPKDAKP